MSEGPRRTGSWIAAGLALAVALAVRVHNAVAYTQLWGFDARENWRYILRLTRSWALPPPDASWSTAHPPLFYYAGAALTRALSDFDRFAALVGIRLLGAAFGLLIALLAFALVRRADPDDERRALLAGGLVLFLPVHVYMSAMLSEELWVAGFIAVVLAGLACELSESGDEPRPAPARAALLGVAGGLAFLTKLTGVLVVVAGAGAIALHGWRRAQLRPALGSAALFTTVALVVGGWFYARNLVSYGYLYPHGLEPHKVMFDMPPGERGVGDYFRLPRSTFLDPQVIDPDLLHSVWGTTYTTLWFDGHRHFLPRENPTVTAVGTWILTLALLPSAAFFVGLFRGLRRALEARAGPDALLVGITGLTLAGYVLFTWRNPWFPVLKGSFLLGLSLPFAYYTSEVLTDWGRRGRLQGILIWSTLLLLALSVTATFTFSELFWSTRHMPQPGVRWWLYEGG